MSEIDQQRLEGIVQTAARDVFGTMLGFTLEPRDPYVDERAPTEPTKGIVALIGFAGQWAGTGIFTCSAEFACKLSSAMLMAEYAAVNEDVLDAVAEVTNMILGNVKTELEAELGPMGLSIPTVIFGRNFTTRSLGRHEWIVVPFQHEGERMEVQITLAPSRTPEAPRPGFVRPYGVHV